MKLTKAKYLLFSSVTIAVAVFTLLGSANVIISAAKFAFADDVIPGQETCRYYDGSSTYGTEFSGVNTLNKDVSRNYILNACSVNLAGYDLTGKYDNGPVIEAYSMSFISGAGGTIAPKTGSAEPTIMITSNGIVQVSNVSLSTPAGYTADVITNNGTATLNEVTTAGNITNNNTMIINSGTYTGGTYGTSRIGSYYSGSLTINGGTFSNTIDGGAGNAVIINDGNFAGAQINAPSPQINGGAFSDTDINTDAAITGGIFTDGTTIASGSTISGGSFDNTVSISSGVTIAGGTFATAPSPSQVPAGKKVIQNADGSYSVVDDPDSGDSGGDDSGDSGGGDSGGDSGDDSGGSDDDDYATGCVYEEGGHTFNVLESTLTGNADRKYTFGNGCILNLAGYTLTDSIDFNNTLISESTPDTAIVNGGNGTIDRISITVYNDTNLIIKDTTIIPNSEDYTLDNAGRLTLENISLTGGHILNYSELEGTRSASLVINSGDYDGTEIETGGGHAETVINGGYFKGANILSNADEYDEDGELVEGAGRTIINGGLFIDTTLEGPNFIIYGGTFSTAPNIEFLAPGKRIISNADGTYSVVDIETEPDSPSVTPDSTPISTPDTGILGKLRQNSVAEITIGGTLTIAAAILSLCVYLLFRLHKLYRIRH